MGNFNIHSFFKKQYLTEEIDGESAEYYFDYLTKLRDSGVTNMFGAGSYLQAEFGLDKLTARQILAKWMQSFSENVEENKVDDGKAAPHGSGYNELKENEGLNSRSEAYYNELVPSSGNSDKLEGEILRAINRIIYRHYNDGDFFYKGYGAETAGPAHSFLTNSREIPFELQSTLTSIFNKAIGAPEDGYERLIYLALEKILDYIDSKEGVYTDNKDDMFNYDSEFQDEEEYEDDDDDWGGYADEEDDDYYQ
jgi:hypothetical protein